MLGLGSSPRWCRRPKNINDYQIRILSYLFNLNAAFDFYLFGHKLTDDFELKFSVSDLFKILLLTQTRLAKAYPKSLAAKPMPFLVVDKSETLVRSAVWTLPLLFRLRSMLRLINVQ